MAKIFIDAGHNNSGYNTGAVGNGLKEQDITFAVAKLLGELLTAKGLEIKLSRPTKETNLGTNNSTSINTRYTMANNWGADYFISIHCNAGGGTGAETLYYKADSKAYAQTIQDTYIAEMGLRDRGIKYRSDIGVIKNAKMPSVLIELAFIDTVADAAVLKDKQPEMAQAVAKGFYKLLGITDTAATETQTPTASAAKIDEAVLTALQNAAVINSPDYWRGECVQGLNELLTASVALVGAAVNNGITDFDKAVEILQSAGVVDKPDHWIGLINGGTVKYLKDLLINLANRCKIVLQKIVMAEAGGEDEKGQILVANVIFNRVNAKGFPNCIYDVVFQEKQFEPTRNGAYEKAVPSAGVKTAVDKALAGEDYSQGALYFRSTKGAEGSWHETALTKLFEHGGHAFYTE